MRKILLFWTLTLFSVISFAAVSITVTPSSVDFGEYSIKGKSYVEDSVTFNVTYSGLLEYCGIVYKDDEMPADGAYFWISGTSTAEWIYGGDEWIAPEGTGLQVHFMADKAGVYTGKFRFFSYETEDDWYNEIPGTIYYLTVTVSVTDEAIVAKTVPFERIEDTSDLHSGDTIIFVCESATEVSDTLDGAALSAISEGLKIENGKADVPEGTQMFRLVSYADGWQFYTVEETPRRLHLDVVSNPNSQGYGKGAFTFAEPVADQILATWAISITDGDADVTRNDEGKTYPVRWVSSGNPTGRFKPYLNSTGSDIQLYKKVGAAQEIQSSVTINPTTVAFANEVEMGEQDSIVIAYTAENLTAGIVWLADGPDAAHFNITSTGDSTSGTIKIKYLGTKTETGATEATLVYMTQNAKLDPIQDSYPISLTLKANTIKLTDLAFSGAPTSIEQGQSIDMSQYLVFTPNDAEDKSLTWTTDHSYQGTVDENGVLTAMHVTGTVTVTATSVRVPSVSASATLNIVAPTITDFTLSDSELTLYVGGKDTLSVTAFVPDYASATPSYSSDHTEIAGVHASKGYITAKAIGDAVITATIGEVSKTCTVHVIATPVESVAFDPNEVNLTVGSKLQLNPTILPAQAALDHDTAFVSGNEAVATVSATGLVTGVAAGDAVITATIDGKSAEITIHVVAPLMFEKVTDATTLGAKDTIILANILTISEVQTPTVAGAVNNSKNSLDVSTEGVTINDNGAAGDDALVLVLGGSAGNFTLTALNTSNQLASSDGAKLGYSSTKNNTWSFSADANGVTAVNNADNTKCICYNSQSKLIRLYAAAVNSTPLYVYVRKYIAPAAESVSLNKHELDMKTDAQDVTLKATVTPSEAAQAVVWASSDETVATVDANGKVHPVGAGTANIIVTVASNALLSDTCVVTVSEWTVESISLECGEEETIEIGETLRIFYTVLPSGHTFEVTMSSNHPEIASVENETVTGVAEGDAVITVQAGDKTATVTVHVIEPLGIEDIHASGIELQKVLIDGQVYIIRNGEIYTTTGCKVK